MLMSGSTSKPASLPFVLKCSGITFSHCIQLMCFVCSFSVLVTVDNKPVQLQLCDTAGQVSITSFSLKIVECRFLLHCGVGMQAGGVWCWCRQSKKRVRLLPFRRSVNHEKNRRCVLITCGHCILCWWRRNPACVVVTSTSSCLRLRPKTQTVGCNDVQFKEAVVWRTFLSWSGPWDSSDNIVDETDW